MGCCVYESCRSVCVSPVDRMLPIRITDGYIQTNNLLFWNRTPSLAHSHHASDCVPPLVTLPAARVSPRSRWDRVFSLASTSQHLDYMRALRRPARSRQEHHYTTMVPSILLQEPWREPVGRAHDIQEYIGMGYADCISCDGDNNIS